MKEMKIPETGLECKWLSRAWKVFLLLCPNFQFRHFPPRFEKLQSHIWQYPVASSLDLHHYTMLKGTI